MSAFKTIMDQISDVETMSSVREEPMQLVSDQRLVPIKKAIVRECDDRIVSVVGAKYQPVQPTAMIERFGDSLDQSGLDLTGMTIDANSGEKGARSIFHLRLPAHTIEMKKGDPTHLQLVARNSFDGSWPFRVDVGGFRMACANGQVVGDFISAFSARHTQGLSYDGMVDGLGRAAEMFNIAGHTWLSYKKLKISKDEGQDLMLDYLGKAFADDEEKIAYLARKSARRDSLMDKFADYGKELGWNVLAAYNAMTDDATHGTTDPLVQFTRGKRLSEVCDNHLALAA